MNTRIVVEFLLILNFLAVMMLTQSVPSGFGDFLTFTIGIIVGCMIIDVYEFYTK